MAVVLSSASFPAGAQVPRPDQAKFREIYKELVETNTTLSSGELHRWPPRRWQRG